ncbi:hypothetical protein [Vibrio ouci]|uniref:hypothetical protein n=1 Tax=Vibrio ouci TaxID=2499078 RepID=UPI00142DC4A4|nr:hypothetical protein [Vibrio ouci]
MKKSQLMFIYILVVHLALLVGSQFIGGSDFELYLLLGVWGFISIFGAFQLRSEIRAQGTNTWSDKLIFFIACLLALAAVIAISFILFLAIALNGADFR